MKNKRIFSKCPKFFEIGQKVRLCFDIEEVIVPDYDDNGEQIGYKTAYSVYEIYVSHPMEYENLKEQILAEGFDEFKAQETAAEVMLYINNKSTEAAKQLVIARISQYDKSDAVNQFTYHGVSMWLDKETRNGLVTRLNAEKLVGKTESTLWMGTQSFTVGIEDCLQMLTELEVYASACYDKTQEHKANVMAKKEVETVLTYDYTTGYPPKLRFGE